MQNRELFDSHLHDVIFSSEVQEVGPDHRKEEAECVASNNGAAQERHLRAHSNLVHLADAAASADRAQGSAGEDENREGEGALHAVPRDGEDRHGKSAQGGAVEDGSDALLRAPD